MLQEAGVSKHGGKDCCLGKVLIIDDDITVRNLLKKIYIKQGYEIQLAASLDAAQKAMSCNFFDLILLDIVFSDQKYSGFDIIKAIRIHQRDCPIILITAYPSVETAVEALHESVFDYLIKPFELNEVIAITNRAFQHQARLNSAKKLKGHPGITDLKSIPLSEREKEVLSLFIKGFSYVETAKLLECKLSTIQTHAKNIYKKLGVHSRAEAVHEALHFQIIER